jgi:hypothetical protein
MCLPQKPEELKIFEIQKKRLNFVFVSWSEISFFVIFSKSKHFKAYIEGLIPEGKSVTVKYSASPLGRAEYFICMVSPKGELYKLR